MEIKNLNCISCGAPITITENLDNIICSSCGNNLSIIRGEGYLAFKLTDKVTQAIEDLGRDTQAAIRNDTEETREELRKIQLGNDLSMTEMKLTNIRTEIRTLQRSQPNDLTRRQLLELRYREYQALEKIISLNYSIDSLTFEDPDKNPDSLKNRLELVSASKKALLSALLTDHREKQALSKVEEQEKILQRKIIELKAYDLRSQTKSLSDNVLSDSDRKSIVNSIKLIDEDLKQLSYIQQTPEKSLIIKELQAKRKILYQKWEWLETERINSLLSSSRFEISSLDMDSAQKQLLTIQQDIRILQGQPNNSIIQSNQIELQRYYEKLYKHINRLKRSETNKKISAAITSLVIWVVLLIILFCAWSIILTIVAPTINDIENNPFLSISLFVLLSFGFSGGAFLFFRKVFPELVLFPSRKSKLPSTDGIPESGKHSPNLFLRLITGITVYMGFAFFVCPITFLFEDPTDTIIMLFGLLLGLILGLFCAVKMHFRPTNKPDAVSEEDVDFKDLKVEE